MRALYKAEDYLDELAHAVASPLWSRACQALGKLAGKIGDVLHVMAC